MRQTNVRGTLSLRGFRKLRTGAIVATGVILLGLGFLAPTVSANEQDGVWVARTVAEVKADIQNIDNLSHYTIKWGDTLSAISGATGLSVDGLVEINRIANRDLIFANNKLYFSEEAFLKDGNTEVKRQRVSIDNSGSRQSYEVETKTDTVTGEQTTTVKQTIPVAVETPAVSAPKSETSVSVAPKAETKAETSNPSSGVRSEGHSGASTPVTDNSPSDTGTTNQPVVSNPSSEIPAPSVSVPKAEEPVAPAPKVEEPATPAPKSDEPVTPAPKVDEPVAPAPKSEEPTTLAPKVEEPASPAPKSDEPVTPAPKSDEPVTPAPKVDEPVAPAPKSEEPTTLAPKVEEPASPAPKSDEPATPAPKVDEPVTPAPKVEESVSPAPKNDESASSVESPSTGNHSDESGAPSTTPTGNSTAPKPSDSTSSPVASGESNSTTQPSGETGKSETPSEPSNTPSAEATNDSGTAATSSPVTDDTTSNVETTEQPVVSNPSSEAATPSTPKNDESASSVESPSTGNHSDESGAPSTTPTGNSTAPKPSDSTSSPVASGESNSTTQPSGETGKSETPSEPSNTPSAEATNDSGTAATSSPVTDDTTSNVETTEQPVVSNSSSESPATSAPKAEEPAAGTTPKADAPSEEVAPKDEKLEEAKKDGKNIIEEIATSKLSEIEKVKDEAEKAKLEAKLNELKDAAIKAINNAKDHDAAVVAADEYQTKIDEINVPGEELPAPNYNKDNLTNGRNEGTTIDNGSTVIGHGSGEATSTTPTQPSSTSEGTSSFRNAPAVQARARRVARSTSEPDGTVNISYNFAGMPDIHGFLSDPGEDNTVTIPAGTSEAQVKELVKEKIQAKIKDLATRGYYVKNDIIFEQDTTVKNYNYVVTFTKEATGTSGFRMAPAVQPRASRNRRSLEQPAPQKVKVNVFYNFDQMKDIAGFLGDINGTSLEIAEGLSNEQVKAAVKSQVEAKKEELSKRGYTFKEDYVYQSNGKDYNYVVTFSKAVK